MENNEFKIEFHELAFLAEACIPPTPIDRSLFLQKMIDVYYNLMSEEQRKHIFDWLMLNRYFRDNIDSNDDIKLFHDRYNPKNQFIVQIKKDESHDDDFDDAILSFKHNGKYYTETNKYINEKFINNVYEK